MIECGSFCNLPNQYWFLSGQMLHCVHQSLTESMYNLVLDTSRTLFKAAKLDDKH